MFGSGDDFFDSVSLWNADNVASPAFSDYCADFAVEASVGHSFLDARVYSDHDAVSRLVFA